MRLFIPITKIDEEKREVHGRLTQEMVDRDGEVLDYASSKPFFEKWSGYFSDATGGRSVGNLRAMHRNVSAGKLTQIDFNDEEKAIDIVAKVVDDAEWQKCVEGVYTGFSAAGKVIKQWRDGNTRRYTADPYEASLADFPCVPSATFSYVKIGGNVESRAFQKTNAAASTAVFADEAGRHLPIDTPSHIRMSLALWGFGKIRARYPDDVKEKISRSIREAARKEQIIVTDKAMARGDFAKGLYDVGQLAAAIDNLRWLQVSARYERESEQDDSPVPDKLLDTIADLMATLKEMVGEECDELLELLDYESGDFATTTKTAGESADAAVFSKAVAKKHMAKAAEIADHARSVQKAMTDMHKAMGVVCKTMGDHCEKLAAFHGDLSGISQSDSGTKKVAGATVEDTAMADEKKTGDEAAAATIEKTAGEGTDFAKMSARMNEMEKRLELAESTAKAATDKANQFEKIATDLAESGAQLVEMVTGRPGILKSVDKADDAATGTETIEKTAGAGKTAVAPTTPREAFRNAFRKPEIQSGLPGTQS